eukprot:1078578-Amorphochlora_amoeboformis.AAC.1
MAEIWKGEAFRRFHPGSRNGGKKRVHLVVSTLNVETREEVFKIAELLDDTFGTSSPIPMRLFPPPTNLDFSSAFAKHPFSVSKYSLVTPNQVSRIFNITITILTPAKPRFGSTGHGIFSQISHLVADGDVSLSCVSLRRPRERGQRWWVVDLSRSQQGTEWGSLGLHLEEYLGITPYQLWVGRATIETWSESEQDIYVFIDPATGSTGQSLPPHLLPHIPA